VDSYRKQQLKDTSQMIKTKIVYDNPVIIHHKIYSFSNAQETIKGVKEALEIIRKSLVNSSTFNLLIDFSEPEVESDYDIAAHKEWALGFKENNEIKKHVQNVAVLGKDFQQFRAEKEFMEDETHMWFTDYEKAFKWLKKCFLN
jgi:hypothetical protein